MKEFWDNKVNIFKNRGNLMKNITEIDQMVVDIFKNLSGSIKYVQLIWKLWQQKFEGISSSKKSIRFSVLKNHNKLENYIIE